GELLAEKADYGVPTSTTSPESARQALNDATAHLKKLGRLIASGGLDQDDPLYEQAIRDRDAAQTTVLRLAGEARSFRDELAALVQAVEGLQRREAGEP